MIRPTRRSFLASGGALAGTALAGAALAGGSAFAAEAPDWTRAAPESRGFDARAVADTLDAGAALPSLRALLCARDGVLVAERYYGGAEANGVRPINSATKSVCSMLVGLALRDGKLKSLDETVAQLLPEAVAEAPDSPAAAITLRQILSGRTGLAYDPMRYPELIAARPLVRHALTRPAEPVGPPGWSYNDAMVALIAPILARAHGADLATVAARQLFAPLGIERFDWQRDRDGQPLAPGGLALRPRDLLKLAALMADGGRWNGTAVLPEAWVADSLAPKGPATWRAAPMEDIGYGYLWFTGRLHGQRVAWAWGYGAQFARLAPDLKLVVATSATAPPPAALPAQNAAVMALVGRLVQAAT
jgi:CubicO group peptidase (beta-lactamase class C family)